MPNFFEWVFGENWFRDVLFIVIVTGTISAIRLLVRIEKQLEAIRKAVCK